MNETFARIRLLVKADKINVSRHAFRRLAQHNIVSDDLLRSIDTAEVLEDYPDYFARPSMLVLHLDAKKRPIHAVWGVAKDTTEPAALVTAYRPDPLLWSPDFRSRKP